MATNPRKLKALIAAKQARFDAVHAELAGIDLETLQVQLDQANAARAAYVPPRAHIGVDRQERELSLAAGTAANALSNAQSRVRELEREMQRLTAATSAPARVAQAQAATAAQAELVTAASEAVTAAQTTVNNVLGLLADASATYALERDSAARGVLAAAKAGRQGTAALADRGEVESLELALSMAKAELAESQAAHAVAVQAHADANQVLKGAEVDVARLTFELARRDFALNVVQFRKAVGRSYKPSLDLDLMELVHALEAEPAAPAQTDGQPEG